MLLSAREASVCLGFELIGIDIHFIEIVVIISSEFIPF